MKPIILNGAAETNKCPAGQFIDNIVVLHGALICCGGYGVERCKHYEACLNRNGIRLSKNGRRIKIKSDKLGLGNIV